MIDFAPPGVLPEQTIPSSQTTDQSTSTVNVEKLGSAINSGFRALRPLREKKKRLIGEITGQVDSDPCAVNLMAQMYAILMPNLAPPEIKARVSSWDVSKRFEATKLGLELDRASAEDDLTETIRMAIGDALMCPIGIVRTGLRTGAQMHMVDGRNYDPGELFTRNIALDDYSCDTTATNWNEITWEADRIRIPRSILVSMPGIDAAKVGELKKIDRADVEDTNAAERASDTDDHDLIDTVEVWHVAVYSANETRLYLLASNPSNSISPADESGAILWESTFEGPESGPYERLMLKPLPGMLFGMSPAEETAKMHESMRSMTDRMIDMAVSTNRVLGYRAVAKDDASAIMQATTFQAIKMESPGDAQMFDFGGVPKEMYDATAWMYGQWNNATGNLQLVGGRDSNASTATEASYLQANSTLLMRDLQARVKRFMLAVLGQRAWYILNDPTLDSKLMLRLPGGENLQINYSAETREGTPEDFSYDVDLYVPQSQDNMLRWRRLIEFFGSALPAVMPFVQMGLVDPLAFARLFSREFGIQELDEIIKDPSLAMQAMMVHGGPPQQTAKESGQFGVSQSPMMQQQADRAGAMAAMVPGV